MLRSRFDRLDVHGSPTRRSQRRDRPRGEARRLLLENLEVRSLLAFSVLADYTAPAPSEVALANLDADSLPDLIVANPSGGTIDVRLGNGDGTFGPVIGYPAGANAHSFATGDVTGDGVVDVVTINGSEVNLLAGNGDGTFDPPQSIALPTTVSPFQSPQEALTQFPLSVATGDLNADGLLDVVVGTDSYFTQKYVYYGYYGGTYYGYYPVFDGHVNVLLGNGAGLDAAQTHYIGRDRLAYEVATGDVNGDGNADVVTSSGFDLSVLLGNGAGGLSAAQHSGSGSAPQSISLGYVDSDPYLDTILRSGNGVSVQKGDATGRFTPLPSVSTVNYPHSAVLGDVNSDGKLDVVAVGSASRFVPTYYGYYGYYGYYVFTPQATVLLGNGDGSFALPLVSDLGAERLSAWLPDAALQDLTGDGKPELVALEYYSNKAIVAANDGNWEQPPSISISDVTVVEGDSGTLNAEFTVTVFGKHEGDVTVGFSTANGSAAAGFDYNSASGTLTFAASQLSQTSQTISVPVRGDTLDEANEQFFVNLANATNAQIADFTGVGTITDNDPAPTLSIGNVSQSEGARGTTTFSFLVTLSAVSGQNITVNFATANGTAVAGSDYLSRTGTLFIAAGQTSGIITVSVLGDKKKEANETFFANLSGAANATISDGQGQGTIVNDDGGQGKGNGNSGNIAAAFTEDAPTKKRK